MHGTLYLASVCVCLWGCVCDLPWQARMRVCLPPPPTPPPRLYICAWKRVSVHGYCGLGESVHVHYIRQSVWGVPQHVCAAVCSELSAPAGSAIPIYPSAAEVGGKSAGHRCRRFHIRGTRLPVRGPLCGGDEGGRLQGHSVGESGLLGEEGKRREEGGQHDSAPPWNPWALCFLGSVAAKLHICLTPGAVVWQSGAVCPDSHLLAR